MPTIAAVLLGVGAGAAIPLLRWDPLLAWRLTTVVVFATLVAAGWWGDPTRFATNWPLPGSQIAVALLVVLAVAPRHDRNVGITAGVVTVLVDIVPMTVLTGSPLPVPLISTVVVAAVVWSGVAFRTQRTTARRLAAAHRRDLTNQAVLEERARIARELHDVVAHHMSMIAIQAEAAPYKVAVVPEPLGIAG